MRRRAALLSAIVLIAACGCSGESASRRTPRATRSAGTALGDGFVVAPGSRLIGTVFHQPVEQGGTRSWTALLIVDRDPIEVYDAYVAQARSLGILMNGSGVVRDKFPTCEFLGADQYPAADPASATTITCSGTGTQVKTGTRLSGGLSLRWGDKTHHALLTVRRGRATNSSTNLPDPGDTKLSTSARVPKISDRRSTPTPGDNFGIGTNGFNASYGDVVLERGSRLAAPEAIAIERFDFVAVLRIDRDVEQVLSAYARQLSYERALSVQHVETGRGKGALMVSVAPSGGGAGELLSDSSGHWVLVSALSD